MRQQHTRSCPDPGPAPGEELVQGTRCVSARCALVGTLVHWVGCLGSLSQSEGITRVAVMGLEQGGSTEQNLSPITIQQRRWLPHPSPDSGTLSSVPRPPQAQKRVQRHPWDPGMMEMGRSHDGVQLQSKCLFQGSSAGSCS